MISLSNVIYLNIEQTYLNLKASYRTRAKKLGGIEQELKLPFEERSFQQECKIISAGVPFFFKFSLIFID
jgi:hypothetical protein